MSCQTCGSERLFQFSCKHDDRYGATMGDRSIECDYAPRIPNLCGGDYTEATICLNCGQTQGTWPVEPVQGLEDEIEDETE